MRKMFITFLLMSGGIVACTAEETVDSTDVAGQNTVGEVQKTVTQNYDFVITPKNVTGDFRTFFQNVVNKYSNVLIKAGVYEIELVNGDGVRPKDGCTITFEENAKIKVKPNDLEVYSVMDLRGRKNITINNPNFEGDKYTHLNSLGQWGHGFHLKDCDNIVIRNAYITKFWGDGMYLNNCSNIKIYDSHIIDNRRQGMSIISGANIEIFNTIFENTGGTNPGYGIDVEPNKNGENITGLRIYNSTFKNNGNTKGASPVGFCLSTKGVGILNPTIGKFVNSNIDIEIFDPVFEGDIMFITAPSDYAKGSIKVYNPIFNNSKSTALYFRDHQSDFFYTEIINPKFINCVQDSKSSIYLAPVLFYCSTKGFKTTGTKNIKIENPTIEGATGSGFNNFVAIRNIGTDNFKDDLKNVVISNLLVKGYERTFFNHGGSLLNLSDLHSQFSLTFNSKSELPNLSSGFVVSKTLQGATANYIAGGVLPSIYLGDDIPVSNFEFYYINNSKDKSSLKLLFGTKNQPNKGFISRWSTKQMSGIEIPYGGFVKMKKNKVDSQGIQHWTVTEASSSVRGVN